ncbi:MAG TPA: SufD family Fe-S cluster assembly protein, partial [Solirubrobacteraceae bacterium]|nr:SufD family Fe-S cluster assembly protein [Solirubrobacteraceae bacterium]
MQRLNETLKAWFSEFEITVDDELRISPTLRADAVGRLTERDRATLQAMDAHGAYWIEGADIQAPPERRRRSRSERALHRVGPVISIESLPQRTGLPRATAARSRMATLDRTKITKPSPIVEDEQGQLRARQGISREVVSELSKIKGEPEWMAEKRLKSLEIFERKPIPTWGPDLSGLNLDDLVLYSPPTAGRFNSWDEVPAEMKQTYEDLGIPQAEREHLAGVVGVWRQEPVYEGLKEEYAKQGILFCSMDTAVTEHPELVQKYFMNKCVPPQDNKFSALHGAVWSGGAFCYIPKGVKCDLPLQSYFRMEGAGEGTFEHTLIVADEGAEVNYIEGCTAQTYSVNSMHSAVVEIFVHEGAKARYT